MAPLLEFKALISITEMFFVYRLACVNCNEAYRNTGSSLWNVTFHHESATCGLKSEDRNIYKLCQNHDEKNSYKIH